MAAADADTPADAAFEESDLSKDDVVSKYRQAADIVQAALQAVLKRCVPGADILETCTLGDKLIELQCAKTLKKGKVPKGLAFPTCVSVNHVLCHNSPMDPADSAALAEGDTVKVDMGVHLDGFIAVAAHTGTVTAEGALGDFAPDTVTEEGLAAGPAAPPAAAADEAAAADDAADASASASASASGAGASASASEAAEPASQADVTTAAYVCAELALRLIAPGGRSSAVTAAWARVASHFGVNLCQGVLTHEMKQHVIDGSRVVLAREVKEDDQAADEVVFEKHQVYAIDVAVSSGEGKPRETDARTTVFKRDVEASYGLKMTASRWLLRRVQETSPTLPFSLRALGDAKQARVGVVECAKHGLVVPFPVMAEREGDRTAHFKFTAMLLASGTLKATGLGLPAELRSPKLDSLPEDLAEILARPSFAAKKKKKRSRKRAAKKADAEADA